MFVSAQLLTDKQLETLYDHVQVEFLLVVVKGASKVEFEPQVVCTAKAERFIEFELKRTSRDLSIALEGYTIWGEGRASVSCELLNVEVVNSTRDRSAGRHRTEDQGRGNGNQCPARTVGFVAPRACAECC